MGYSQPKLQKLVAWPLAGAVAGVEAICSIRETLFVSLSTECLNLFVLILVFFFFFLFDYQSPQSPTTVLTVSQAVVQFHLIMLSEL